jgi:calcineurin-like phosphoesterase family protein
MFESINYYLEIKDKNRDVVLCHYPLESWNGMRYGTIHLHGHLHSIPTKLNLQNRYNVGCDNWNYEPVTLDEIIQSKRDYNI